MDSWNEITLVAARTCNFVTSTGPQLVGQLFLIFMIYGEEEAIVAPVVCPQLLHLTLKDPGFWEVYFSEKWSLSYQIVFQVKI